MAVEVIGIVTVDGRPHGLAVASFDLEPDGAIYAAFRYVDGDRYALGMDELLDPDASARDLLAVIVAGTHQAEVLRRAAAEGVGFVEAMSDELRW
jgi:hypothetical protein